MNRVLLAICVFTAFAGIADDAAPRTIKTTDGKTYENAVVTNSSDDGLEITYAKGATFLKFERLDEDLRKEFNYDPEKAKAAAELKIAAKAMAAQEALKTQSDPKERKSPVYAYRGVAISKARFDELFASHGKYLFSNGEKTFWSSGMSLDEHPNIGDCGQISGSIEYYLPDGMLLRCCSVVSSSGGFSASSMSMSSKSKTYWFCKLRGKFPRTLTAGERFDSVAVRTGSDQFALGPIAVLEVLAPASRDEFCEYLAKGGVLKETQTSYGICSQCNGRGRIDNPKKGSMDRALTCPTCNGRKKVIAGEKEVEIQP